MTIPPSPDNTAPKRKIRVIVADDHPPMRAGVVGALRQQADMEVVGEAADSNAAFDLVQTQRPDVAVLDLRMPGVPAVELVQQVRALPEPPHVLMLSAFGEVDDVLPLLQSGVTGYLLKDASLAEIVAAVRAAAQGEIRLSPTVAANMAVQQARSIGEPPQPQLTPREREILRLLTDGKSNREIAMLLKISESTVEAHLTEIFRELKVTSRGAASARAVRERLV